MIPRRVIPVDDAGTVVRLPASPRRTSSPPPARTALTAVRRAVPVGMRQVGRNDPDYLGITPGSTVRNPAARGNAVALAAAVQAVDISEDDTPLAPNFYRMAAYERERVGAVAAVGGDERFLFSGQRAMWEDADSLGGSGNRGQRSSPDYLYLRPGQRAIWEDTDETLNSRYSRLRTEGASSASRQKKVSHSIPFVRKPQQSRRSTVVLQQAENQTLRFWQDLRDAVCDGFCLIEHLVREVVEDLPETCGRDFDSLCDGLCGGPLLTAQLPTWQNTGEGHGVIHRIIDMILNQGIENRGWDHQQSLDRVQEVINGWWNHWMGNECNREEMWNEDALEVIAATQASKDWTYDPFVPPEQEWDYGFLDDIDAWVRALAMSAALRGIGIRGFYPFIGPTAELRYAN